MLYYIRRIGKVHGQKIHLDETDVQYLTRCIWDSKSCLSGNIEQLVLMPWKKQEDIYPWDCILVTKKEARRHSELVFQLPSNGILTCHYSSELISKIEKTLKRVSENRETLP